MRKLWEEEEEEKKTNSDNNIFRFVVYFTVILPCPKFLVRQIR